MELYVIIRDSDNAIIDGATYTNRAEARYQTMLLNRGYPTSPYSTRELGAPIPAQPCPDCGGHIDRCADCLTCDGTGLAVERAQ